MTPNFSSALVTGGAGFIGSHLVDALLDHGVSVAVLDNLTSGREENLAPVRDRIDFRKGDIRDADALADACQGRDVVFHEAAVVSVPQTVEDPVGSALVNDIGTLQVLEAARKSGVRRVVLASSSAVYGDDPTLPKREDMAPLPKSPYAVQKLTGEFHAALYQELYGLETVCLRYFNVYGPRQDPSSPYSGVISIFMDKAFAGEAPKVHGDGEQSRDFVFVADVVRANLLAASVEAAAGGRFNVGVGDAVTINQLWGHVARMSGLDLSPEYGPPRPGDIRHSRSAIERARGILGFEPAAAFEDGLARTLEWHRARRNR
jgi:UDP-glucose 4-epimerase